MEFGLINNSQKNTQHNLHFDNRAWKLKEEMYAHFQLPLSYDGDINNLLYSLLSIYWNYS